MSAPDPMIGMLRRDVELISGDPPMLFDRQSDAYFRVAPEALNILAFLTESMPISQFIDRLNKNGIAVSPDDLLKLLAGL